MKATDAMVILLDAIKTPDQIAALRDLLLEATENAYNEGVDHERSCHTEDE